MVKVTAMCGREILTCLLLLLISLQLSKSEIKPAPEKGKNVCAYDKVKVEFNMRRNSTTIKSITSRKCNIPGFMNLRCREAKYETRIYWYPVRSDRRYISYDCCPGWQGYKKGVGCLQVKPCEVKISQKADAHCKAKREKEVAAVKTIYKLGTVPGLPFAVTDIDAMKLINMHMADPFTKTWMQLYIYMLKFNKAMIEAFPATHKKEFTSIKEYEDVYYFFLNRMKSNPMLRQFFRFPFDTMPFKSVVDNSTWKEDSVFAQMRLAGLNPMCIKRVSTEQGVGVSWSDLSGRLNKEFDWSETIQKAYGRPYPLQMMISDGSVFVCEFPLFNNLVNVPDITEPRQSRKMWPSMSPIAVFVSRAGGNGGPAELIPAAIQMDTKPGSPWQVYTPEDGDLWTLAKKAFEVTDFAHVEMVEHLLKTHLMMEPFCTTIHRHLSSLHPLHQIMKFHCRGLLPNNKIGFPKLVNDKAYMHQLFAIGNKGSLQLLLKAFQTMTWQDTDFMNNIKSRGLDNKKKLPYFPYRDDGGLLYRSIYSFVDDYISHYYRNNGEVASDKELQALANEMSADGTGEDGGKGKLRGFPAKIKSRDILKDIITRLIWTSSAQHSAVNYPIVAYGAFTPNIPTKIYDDERVPEDKFNLYRLPNGNTSAIQAGVAMSLGALHFDDLLDYGPQLADKAGSEIVKDHYQYLLMRVKKEMDDRNKARFQYGYLTYPFLTPGWVPNSICT